MTLNKYLKDKEKFTDEELTTVNSFFTIMSFKKKSMLLEQGNICKYLHFIVNGLVKSYFLDRNGQEVIINFASENWWATDINSFEECKASRMYIEAIEDTECLVLTIENQYKLFDKIPKLERVFRILLHKHTGALQDRLFEHIAATAEDRYDSFLDRYPSLSNRIPQYEIAAYIGVSPEFLSRIRKRRVSK